MESGVALSSNAESPVAPSQAAPRTPDPLPPTLAPRQLPRHLRTDLHGFKLQGRSFTMWLFVLLLLPSPGAPLRVDSGDVDASPDNNPLCASIVCQDKPPGETCVPRSALSLAATAAYGEKRICCSVWSCTLSNGTTALHYGMTARGLTLVREEDVALGAVAEGQSENRTCEGVVCLPGSPSRNCRRYSPPEISEGMMGVGADCCPLWTCTFPSNGSYYYVHSGMTTLSRYWSASTTTFDLAHMTFDENPLSRLPPTSTTPLPRGMREKKRAENRTALLLQVFTGEVEISELGGVREDGGCGGVTCYPPRAPSCLPLQQKELVPLVGLNSSCCPLFACKTNTGRFLLLFFGMFHSDNFTTTTVDMSYLSTTPSLLTTALDVVLTTSPPTTATATQESTQSTSNLTAEDTTSVSTTAGDTDTTTPTETTAGPATTTEATTVLPTNLTSTSFSEVTSKLNTRADGTDPMELTIVGEDYDDAKENGEPALVASSNSDGGCRPLKCYPSPNREKCEEAAPTDCTLRVMLAPALPCCPSYRCNYSTGPLFQFGVTDGVTHTVVASPIQPNDDTSHSCPSTVGSEERKIAYLTDCSSVRCLRPPGVHLRQCQKLPGGGGVPHALRTAGVTRTCCGAWKCVVSGSREALHYEVTYKDGVFIPFEFNGSDAERRALPTELTFNLDDGTPPPNCPDVTCAPPIPGASCRPADPSMSRRVKASLRRRTVCCPIWECTRRNTLIYIYGRMLVSGYANVTFKSIFHGHFFATDTPALRPQTKTFNIEFEEKDATTVVPPPPHKKKKKTKATTTGGFAIEVVEVEEKGTQRPLSVLQMKKRKSGVKSPSSMEDGGGWELQGEGVEPQQQRSQQSHLQSHHRLSQQQRQIQEGQLDELEEGGMEEGPPGGEESMSDVIVMSSQGEMYVIEEK